MRQKNHQQNRQKNHQKNHPGKPPRKHAHSAAKPLEKHGKHGTAPSPSRPAPRPAPHPGGPAPDHAGGGGGNWLYGIHAVQAALANPRRRLGRALVTPRAAELIGEKLLAKVPHETAEPGAIARLLPPGAVHQGVALDARPLKAPDLETVLAAPAPTERQRRIVLVLDQLSDPHNVGAILRTAAAFGVAAVVVQDRHAPPQSGALAKAASGALDMVPYVAVVNIARALDMLAEHGFWRIALEQATGKEPGKDTAPIAATAADGDVALVLGSEGAGLRRLVREHCDSGAFIPMHAAMESLNVSNAAAIALYELRRGSAQNSAATVSAPE